MSFQTGLFFWSIACLESYENDGDLAFAKEMWPHVFYTLKHYLKHIDNRGLLFMRGWNFLDWSPIDQPRHGAVSHQNMFFVKALRSSAQLGEAVGDKEGAKQLREAADQLRAAINTHLWSEEAKAYIDCIHADGRRSTVYSIQTQVVAILCNIAEEKKV